MIVFWLALSVVVCVGLCFFLEAFEALCRLLPLFQLLLPDSFYSRLESFVFYHIVDFKRTTSRRSTDKDTLQCWMDSLEWKDLQFFRGEGPSSLSLSPGLLLALVSVERLIRSSHLANFVHRSQLTPEHSYQRSAAIAEIRKLLSLRRIILRIDGKRSNTGTAHSEVALAPALVEGISLSPRLDQVERAVFTTYIEILHELAPLILRLSNPEITEKNPLAPHRHNWNDVVAQMEPASIHKILLASPNPPSPSRGFGAISFHNRSYRPASPSSPSSWAPPSYCRGILRKPEALIPSVAPPPFKPYNPPPELRQRWTTQVPSFVTLNPADLSQVLRHFSPHSSTSFDFLRNFPFTLDQLIIAANEMLPLEVLEWSYADKSLLSDYLWMDQKFGQEAPKIRAYEAHLRSLPLAQQKFRFCVELSELRVPDHQNTIPWFIRGWNVRQRLWMRSDWACVWNLIVGSCPFTPSLSAPVCNYRMA